MRFDRLCLDAARQAAASSDPNILNQFASPTVHVHQLGRCCSEFVLHEWAKLLSEVLELQGHAVCTL